MRTVILTAIIVLAAACGGNQYGFARQYEPLSEEEAYLEKAEVASYEELRRDPEAYRNRLIGWFGVVTGIESDPSTGKARAAMQLHFHQQRHLCTDEFENSCRVTISDRSGGPFTALVTLRSEDREGKNRVYQGSLLKVYGSPNGDFDEEGGPVLEARYYRHWPRGTFVTTALQSKMRR